MPDPSQTQDIARAVAGLDPSPRATENLLREIASLKELVFARLSAIEKTHDTFKEGLLCVPAEMTRATKALEAVTDQKLLVLAEKFGTIALQFEERDVRTEQTRRDSAAAISAALQAQKEAVTEQNKSSALAIAKSEAATSKQIDAQSTQITSSTVALDGKIADIKDRLTALENRSLGQAAERSTRHDRDTDSRGNAGLWVSLASLAVTLIVLFAGVVAFTVREPTYAADRPTTAGPAR